GLSVPGDAAPSAANLLGLEFAGLPAEGSMIPENLTVDGSHADALTAFWIQLDQDYVESGSYYDLDINTAFAYLGNDYARYLEDGNAPLMDIVKVGPNRFQTLHDNLLGNLGDIDIASRFDDDPRNEFGALFGGRPY